jgi:hypothetical protein
MLELSRQFRIRFNVTKSRSSLLLRVFAGSHHRHRYCRRGSAVRHDAVSAQVMSSIREMLGDTGAKAVETMLAAAGLLPA